MNEQLRCQGCSGVATVRLCSGAWCAKCRDYHRMLDRKCGLCREPMIDCCC